MLVAENVGLDGDGRSRLDAVSLSLPPGELHVLLGANGAGKTSLMRLMAGDIVPRRGTVSLDGRRLSEWPARELARRRAVLPQGDNLRFGFTVREVVGLGRMAARTGTPAAETRLIDQAMQDTDVRALADRRYPGLSGGERQRVQLARVLVQLGSPDDSSLEGRYLLLDEPTAALDLVHQHACLALARSKARLGAGVLAVLHDINLAARVADRISLLHEGRVLAQGSAAQVLTAEHLQAAYGASLRFQAIRSASGLQFQIGSVLDAIVQT